MDFIENRTFDEIAVGDSATLTRTLTPADIQRFAALSGDVNPAHIDPEYARSTMFQEVIAHGMWGGALISTVLGTQFPGPGTVYVSQSLKFSHPVAVGDVLTVTVTVTGRFERTRHLILDCQCVNQHGQHVIGGTAEVLAPSEKVRRPRIALPEAHLRDHATRHRQLMDMTAGMEPLSIAVAHPCDRESLGGAIAAAQAGLIRPLLIGPTHKIWAAARELDIDLSGYTLVGTEHSHAAAATAVEYARSGRVEAIMKGSLHTDELMTEVVDGQSGLRTGRRISHVFVMDVPAYAKPLLITDAAVNIDPDLETKRDIAQNAIDLALLLGIAEPKVAILSAVETVTPKLKSTLEAAALCKMAERGQIVGAVLDGPLAFDNAISPLAAKTKGIVSAVAGYADILLVPDLESGNMLAKQLEYLADARAAGVVMGARVPIVLTSRADSIETRIASSAVALLMARRGHRA